MVRLDARPNIGTTLGHCLRNAKQQTSPQTATRCPPKSQIIFLSQHDSLNMAKEAMKVGGHGYVTKIDAASELLKAIHAVAAFAVPGLYPASSDKEPNAVGSWR